MRVVLVIFTYINPYNKKCPQKSQVRVTALSKCIFSYWCHTVIIILGMVYRFKFSRCWSNVHFKIILDSSKKCSICLLRDWPEGIRSCHIIQPTTRRTRFEAKQSHHTPYYTNNKKWTNFSFVDPFVSQFCQRTVL